MALALPDLVQTLDAERQRHALLGAEQIHGYGIARGPARGERRVFEQQRRSAARGLHAAVRDLRDFLVHGHGVPHVHELSAGVERAEEVPQIIECHDAGRRSRPSGSHSLRSRTRRPRAGARRRPGPESRAPTLAGRYRRPYVSTPRGRSRGGRAENRDRKSTRLNSSHLVISYAVFCLKKKKITIRRVKI